jgi:hypothetical protein
VTAKKPPERTVQVVIDAGRDRELTSAMRAVGDPITGVVFVDITRRFASTVMLHSDLAVGLGKSRPFSRNTAVADRKRTLERWLAAERSHLSWSLTRAFFRRRCGVI